MAYGDNSTRKTNVSAGAPRYLIDKGRPIQNIGTAHPFLRLILGKETTVADEKLGSLLRYSGVKKPKGEKMEANHQGATIPTRALTRASSLNVTTKTDPNAIFNNSFPYARLIQTWNIPGIDMDRIGSDGYFDPIDSYMNSADQGMFDDVAAFWFGSGLASTSQPASLDAMISDGANIGSYDETAFAQYGDILRGTGNTALNGIVVRGTGGATTGFGAMSKTKFKIVQALCRRNGGACDVFLANDLVVAGWAETFQEQGDKFESKYDPILHETGALYIKYANTLIVGDPGVTSTKGYMLDLSTFETFWDGLAPGSRANTTKVRGDAQVRVDYIPGDEDDYVVKRIMDMGWYITDPRKNAKVLGITG